MADRNAILREKTFKEEGMEVERRVFYTLSDDETLQAHRNSKALALLIKLLRDNGVVTEKELDELLFKYVW